MAFYRASLLPLLLLLLTSLPRSISAAANAPPSPGASAQEANTAPAPASAAPVTVKLGFLLPVQERNLDIPLNLAREWGSAAQVALDVLATRYTGFAIKPVFQAVECTAENAAVGADALVKQGVAGVVGPACSEAAVGAAPVLGRAGIPMVSFAATADALRNRTAYPTFFRTAFGDRHQAAAIRSVVDQLQWKRLLVFHTAETYGEALAYDVAQEPQLQVRTVRIPHPPPADCSAYFPPAADDWMKGSEDMGVVLAVLPSTASCLWAAASKLNLLGYPWWYLGTDGVAALDLMDAAPQSGEEMLANRMLNELALVPSGADPSGEQPFAPFKAYWQQQSYAAFPGLLTFDASPRFSAPRAFVPHLVDAVWAFHEAVNKTVGEHGASLSASHLLACFNDSPADCVSFPGATGHVHFDSDSGERTKVQASPRYSLMQFAGLPWMPVGEWVEQHQPRLKLTQETPLQRPADPAAVAAGETNGSPAEGAAPPDSSSNNSSTSDSSGNAGSADVSVPAQQSAANEPFTAAPPNESGSSSSSSSGGTIAIAVVCSVMLVALLAIIGAMLWSKRQYLYVHEEPKHQIEAGDADVIRGGVHLL